MLTFFYHCNHLIKGDIKPKLKKGKEKGNTKLSVIEYMAVIHSIYHILQLEIKSFYYLLELFWTLRKPLKNHVAA